MHDDYDLRQEQLNKASLLSSKKFLENLLEKFITNVVKISFKSFTELDLGDLLKCRINAPVFSSFFGHLF